MIYLALCLCVGFNAWAIEYRSVSVDDAVVYDAPSEQAKKHYTLSVGYPIEVVIKLDGWIKFRDALGGGLFWLPIRQTSEKRTVVVNVALADIRATADNTAALVFQAKNHVILELLETPVKGWAKVKHRDGLSGYVQLSSIWGA